jgi:pantoate--beta-alanine ligase
MQIVKSPKRMQKICGGLKREGKIIGLVPTMGYLHEGHLSLVRIAKRKSDVLVVSVFVNPTQFGPKEDFGRYPRDYQKDRLLLEKEECDYIFVPRLKDIYPENYSTYVNVEDITRNLEGEKRPGHFRGVTTIVAKLFNIVQPDISVFGQKDAQQAVVLKKMTDDLNFGVRVIIGPTIREKDGLALSSRNNYLSEEERKQSPILFQSLQEAKGLINKGERNPNKVMARMRNMISKQPLAKLEYIAVTDTKKLKPLRKIKGEILISLAARFGKARLIDNVKLRVKS